MPFGCLLNSDDDDFGGFGRTRTRRTSEYQRQRKRAPRTPPRAKFSPFGTGLAGLMAHEQAHKQSTTTPTELGTSKRPVTALTSSSFVSSPGQNWRDQERTDSSAGMTVPFVRPPACHRPWARCLRVTFGCLQLNLPVEVDPEPFVPVRVVSILSLLDWFARARSQVSMLTLRFFCCCRCCCGCGGGGGGGVADCSVERAVVL